MLTDLHTLTHAYWLQHIGAELLSIMGYLIGDVAGLSVCFLMLMYVFRFARLLAKVDTA